MLNDDDDHKEYRGLKWKRFRDIKHIIYDQKMKKQTCEGVTVV